MPLFQYSVLNSQQIRFLALHPGAPQDPLAGTLFVDDLDQDREPPYYEALSYCWGDQSSPDTILLKERVWSGEGGDVDIGRNLAAALRQLRHPQQERIIWCDAICINQKDLAERSLQVKRMTEIYSLAAKVMIWLGPETSWSTTAMNTLRWAGNQIKSSNYSVEHTTMYYNSRETADPRIHDPDTPLPLSTEQWRAIEHLLDLDWHKRLWTLQEVALADERTCTVALGHEEMMWATFKDTLLFVSTFKQPAPDLRLDPVRYSSNVTTFTIKAQIKNYRGNCTLMPAILWSSTFQCSDDRDKVFACRGLVEPEAAQAIEVDYTKSTKEVFASVCLDTLFREQSLQFLGYCKAPVSPSWVADLGRPFALAVTDGNVAPKSVPEACLIEPGVLEVAGVFCDELVGAPLLIPAKETLLHTPAGYLEVIADAVQSLCSKDLLQDDTRLDPLIMALTYGSVRDYYIETLDPMERSPLRSIADWRNKIRGLINGDLKDGHDTVDPDEVYQRSTPGEIYASGCVKTRKDCYIRVPPESLKGDLVVVILGLDQPLVLRPGTKPNTYSVIGSCYHPGLADGTALLGNEVSGWERLWDRGLFQTAFHKEGILRYTDPRLDDVPLEDGFYEVIQTINGRKIPLWLHKENDVKDPLKDPRMREGALLKRGVPVKRLQLI
ncbi:hypothetical protein FVEN_g11573 [Fusarium venenatum]|uniref:Heterokaryon incompatibility domain-containing protein n=1 Tax=Fusarium venenatum TaxID=56646 RepID=A0A2L2TNX1_9HYPO|nr:uncharacterized protein FVRRES_03963 [Fusarium venenatum]KAG8350255.1 hypothetical protein FVEN_g11573 [Fusarium venenatum]CEI67451.1 unnamed protein product [Fusarium venenatum]